MFQTCKSNNLKLINKYTKKIVKTIYRGSDSVTSIYYYVAEYASVCVFVCVIILLNTHS